MSTDFIIRFPCYFDLEPYREARRRNPDDVYIRINLILALLLNMRFQEACTELVWSVYDFPENAQLLVLFGLWVAAENPEAAITIFQTAIGRDARCYPAYAELGHLYERQGQPDQARQVWKEMLDARGVDETSEKGRELLQWLQGNIP
jgi:tetratricopeptide (TPR) repeat protein